MIQKDNSIRQMKVIDTDKGQILLQVGRKILLRSRHNTSCTNSLVRSFRIV